MSRFNRFGPPTPQGKLTKTGANGTVYVDWKDIESLRRAMSPNGKIYGRKRLGTTAREQKMVAAAVKRARFMGLLPFTSATL
ncbi:MAG: 30S ribosomal protein S18 [Leptolyngbya sp. PLA3]|nr:MAG: 30S ribosomal protein S18 [Cyanobacteria bacterium CYA]MCE7967880.1 30S ribosomal protein S18 [Leptolyngbya sp. PL-A3]MCL4221102.1 30S ribosomal protein S18 [Phycisphaerales bacterium]